VAEAMRLEGQKGALSRRYVIAAENLKAAQKHLAQVAPDLLATLRRHHETFRAMLQVNLTVLATAHAVSEGIVAASTPRCSAAIFPTPTPRPDSAPRRARARSGRSRSAARCKKSWIAKLFGKFSRGRQRGIQHVF
jgi:hypothetical protein